MLQDEQLRDHSPHRVTDESAFADVEILQQLVDIGSHRPERISVLTRWLRGRPMPAQVHGDHAEALGQRGRGQRPVPRVTRVTVHQDNRKAFTRLAVIDLNIIYGCLRHESSPESVASIARGVRAGCRGEPSTQELRRNTKRRYSKCEMPSRVHGRLAPTVDYARWLVITLTPAGLKRIVMGA